MTIVNLKISGYVILQNNFIMLPNFNQWHSTTHVSGPPSQSSTQSEEVSNMNVAAQLSVADLALVVEMVFAAKAKWFSIGLALKIPNNELELIEDEKVDADRGLRKMLLVWLRTGSNKTWRVLAEALGHDLVMEVNLKKSIIARYSPDDILTSTKEADISKFEVVYLLELVIQ